MKTSVRTYVRTACAVGCAASVLAIADGCGTHFSALDTGRIETCVDLAASIRHDLPDSGPVRIKGESLLCDLQAIEKSGGLTPTDAGVLCPKQH
jgi:hypothetical protein